MAFDNLLDDAASAADAADAARVMAAATVEDADASEDDRAAAQAILDLDWDELVGRFEATSKPAAGGRHEASGSAVSALAEPAARGFRIPNLFSESASSNIRPAISIDGVSATALEAVAAQIVATSAKMAERGSNADRALADIRPPEGLIAKHLPAARWWNRDTAVSVNGRPMTLMWDEGSTGGARWRAYVVMKSDEVRDEITAEAQSWLNSHLADVAPSVDVVPVVELPLRPFERREEDSKL